MSIALKKNEIYENFYVPQKSIDDTIESYVTKCQSQHCFVGNGTDYCFYVQPLSGLEILPNLHEFGPACNHAALAQGTNATMCHVNEPQLSEFYAFDDMDGLSVEWKRLQVSRSLLLSLWHAIAKDGNGLIRMTLAKSIKTLCCAK